MEGHLRSMRMHLLLDQIRRRAMIGIDRNRPGRLATDRMIIRVVV